jgi:hypothetical protein
MARTCGMIARCLIFLLRHYCTISHSFTEYSCYQRWKSVVGQVEEFIADWSVGPSHCQLVILSVTTNDCNGYKPTWLTDWLIYDWVWDLTVPMHVGLNWRGPLFPIQIHGSPVTLLKFQMATRLLMSSGFKKQPRYTCLSEAKSSHSQRIWAEVLSSVPQLHNGLSTNQ